MNYKNMGGMNNLKYAYYVVLIILRNLVSSLA